MGFWDFLPWVGDDKPAPAPTPAPAPAPAPKSSPTPKPSSAKSSNLPQWKPPANLPAPPQVRQGSAPSKPASSTGGTPVVLPWGVAAARGAPGVSQPSAAPAPLTAEQKAAPPQMSDELRTMLNEAHWELPTEANSKKSPETLLEFEKDGASPLHDYSYTITNAEWDRIKNTYSTPGARERGYAPPPDMNLSSNMPVMNLKGDESLALTWDAYEALSRDQRAAVDFNTLLINAREKDLNQSTYQSPEVKTAYDDTVKKIFGEGGGSNQLAPNTVDLLSKLDLNLVGQDLDEYLSLERAIDINELGDFKFSDADIKTIDKEINGSTPTYTEVRAPENLAAIDTAAIQKAQQVIKTALTSPEALTYDFDSLMYGPSAEQQLAGQPPIGFGNATTQWTNMADAEMNGWFQRGLQLLSSPDLSLPASEDLPNGFQVPAGTDPMSLLLADMQGLQGYDKDTQQKFLSFLQNQVDLRGQYGTEEDATMAAMIAKRAGLGG